MRGIPGENAWPTVDQPPEGPRSDVSVIVTVCGDSPYLQRAVDSVRFQANAPGEVLVVKYQPPDEDVRAAAWLGLPAAGLGPTSEAAARNQGLMLTRHDFVAFLSAEDVWPTGCVDGHLSGFLLHPEADVILGHTQEMDEGGTTLLSEATLTFNAAAALFRRSVFTRIGLFDESPEAEDVEWFMRARDLGIRMHVRDEVTLYYAVEMTPPTAAAPEPVVVAEPAVVAPPPPPTPMMEAPLPVVEAASPPPPEPVVDRRALKRKKQLTLKKLNQPPPDPTR